MWQNDARGPDGGDGVRVAVVEDDPTVAQAICGFLSARGDDVVSCDRLAGLWPERRVDAVLLDLGLGDGWWGAEGPERIRSRFPDAGIIVVTADGKLGTKLATFRGGADDYLVKPFHLEELAVRLDAVLRRQAAATDTVILDQPGRRALVEGQDIHLTPLEYAFFAALWTEAGRVRSRRDLLGVVMGAGFYGDERVVDVHLAHVRKKLGPEAQRLETVRAFGYRWRSS